MIYLSCLQISERKERPRSASRVPSSRLPLPVKIVARTATTTSHQRSAPYRVSWSSRPHLSKPSRPHPTKPSRIPLSEMRWHKRSVPVVERQCRTETRTIVARDTPIGGRDISLEDIAATVPVSSSTYDEAMFDTPAETSRDMSRGYTDVDTGYSEPLESRTLYSISLMPRRSNNLDYQDSCDDEEEDGGNAAIVRDEFSQQSRGLSPPHAGYHDPYSRRELPPVPRFPMTLAPSPPLQSTITPPPHTSSSQHPYYLSRPSEMSSHVGDDYDRYIEDEEEEVDGPDVPDSGSTVYNEYPPSKNTSVTSLRVTSSSPIYHEIQLPLDSGDTVVKTVSVSTGSQVEGTEMGQVAEGTQTAVRIHLTDDAVAGSRAVFDHEQRPHRGVDLSLSTIGGIEFRCRRDFGTQTFGQLGPGDDSGTRSSRHSKSASSIRSAATTYDLNDDACTAVKYESPVETHRSSGRNSHSNTIDDLIADEYRALSINKTTATSMAAATLDYNIRPKTIERRNQLKECRTKTISPGDSATSEILNSLPGKIVLKAHVRDTVSHNSPATTTRSIKSTDDYKNILNDLITNRNNNMAQSGAASNKRTRKTKTLARADLTTSNDNSARKEIIKMMLHQVRDLHVKVARSIPPEANVRNRHESSSSPVARGAAEKSALPSGEYGDYERTRLELMFGTRPEVVELPVTRSQTVATSSSMSVLTAMQRSLAKNSARRTDGEGVGGRREGGGAEGHEVCNVNTEQRRRGPASKLSNSSSTKSINNADVKMIHNADSSMTAVHGINDNKPLECTPVAGSNRLPSNTHTPRDSVGDVQTTHRAICTCVPLPTGPPSPPYPHGTTTGLRTPREAYPSCCDPTATLRNTTPATTTAVYEERAMCTRGNCYACAKDLATYRGSFPPPPPPHQWDYCYDPYHDTGLPPPPPPVVTSHHRVPSSRRTPPGYSRTTPHVYYPSPSVGQEVKRHRASGSSGGRRRRKRPSSSTTTTAAKLVSPHLRRAAKEAERLRSLTRSMLIRA